MDPDGRKFKLSIYFTARKRSLGQGNDFTIVCHSVHGGDGGGVQVSVTDTPPLPNRGPLMNRDPPN